MEKPVHVAIIMDGNGRWAKARGQKRLYGHMQGVESIRRVIRGAMEQGVKYLTLYAFSTENWGRPAAEVEALMELFCSCVVSEQAELIAQGVEVRMIGEREGLSQQVQQHLAQIERETASGDKLTLLLAISSFS